MERETQVIEELFRPMIISLFDFTNAQQEQEQMERIASASPSVAAAPNPPICVFDRSQTDTADFEVQILEKEANSVANSAEAPVPPHYSIISLSSGSSTGLVGRGGQQGDDSSILSVDEVFCQAPAEFEAARGIANAADSVNVGPPHAARQATAQMTIQQLWGTKPLWRPQGGEFSPLPLERNEQAPFELFLLERANRAPNVSMTLDPAVNSVIGPALKQLGISGLRPHQESVLVEFARRKSVLAIIPTSGGKSLIYTLPSIAFHSICVVITPTIALREDEIRQLRAGGVNAVSIGHSGTCESISNYDLGGIEECVLFLTPEKLCRDERLQECLSELASELKICMFAVDECHLMLEWSSFRSDFVKLPETLRTILGKSEIPVICLSASIPEDDAAEIERIFSFTGMETLTFDVYRDNLEIHLAYKESVGKKEKAFDQLENLRDHVREYPEKILVYARRTAECDRIAGNLPKALQYHSECKNELENAAEWQQSDKIETLVATVGFGMGVNVKALNSVYLFDFPSSVNDYLQKIGRAGRSGETGRSWFTWTVQDFTHICRIILMDRTGDVIKRVQRLFALNLVLERPVCEFASLEQYYVGYNLQRCNSCTGCANETAKRYREVNIYELSREVGLAFTENSLLAVKEALKSKEITAALSSPEFQGLEKENVMLIVLCELVVGGYARLERRGGGVFLADPKPIDSSYFFTTW